jgi:hypothetical protein
MSFAALSWATAQNPGSMATKMALLALANWANEEGCSYPSTLALAEFGSMNIKTAMAALDRLVGLGLILDTGERAGRSSQIKVYRLCYDQNPPAKRHPKTGGVADERHPKTGASNDRKTPVFSPKDTQKRVTDTIRETDNPPLSPQDDASALIDRWNIIAKSNDLVGISTTFTETQRFEAIIQNSVDSLGIDYVNAALGTLEVSPFWLGKKPGKVNGWKPRPEWVFKPDNLRKIYCSSDRKKMKQSGATSTPPLQAQIDHFTKLAGHCRKQGEHKEASDYQKKAQSLAAQRQSLSTYSDENDWGAL